jgi:transposase
VNATTITFDIAKGVIQHHGVDASFAVTRRKRLSRTGARKFFASLPPCLVGMEACGGARYWAREMMRTGARPGKANPAKRMAGPSAFA